MGRMNLDENTKVITLLASQTVTADADGTGIDVSGYDDCFIIANVGALTGTSPTLDINFATSDAVGGTYTDITGAAFTQITDSANDSQLTFGRIDLRTILDPATSESWLRVELDIGGTSPTLEIGIVAILSNTSDVPTNAQTLDFNV